MSPRDRFFEALANVGGRFPKTVLGIVGACVIGAGALLPDLGVSTSRYGLVAEDDPVQARLVDFFERFGYPDSPLFVIEGGDDDARRRLVDRLSAELKNHPGLDGRILARVGPQEMAEVLMLRAPELLTRLSGNPEERPPAQLIEGGLATIAAELASRLRTFAITLQMQTLTPFGRTITNEQALDAAEGIGVLARGLIATLEGEGNVWTGLMSEALAGETRWSGLDDHGYLTGEDGSFHIIALFPDLPDDEIEALRPWIGELRAVRDRVLTDTAFGGLSARVTGVPTLAVDEMEVLKRGIRQSSLATAAAILLLLFVAFRSVRQTILAGLPLAVGIVVTLGVARLLYGDLNLVTSSAISVLLGLGIDFSVHTLARFNEIRRGGLGAEEAIAVAIRVAGPAIVIGALTTALAFLTTMTTDFTAFAELGVLTAIGLLITLLATFLISSPLMALSERFHGSTAPEVPGLGPAASWILGAPRTIAAVALVLCLAAIAVLPRLSFNARYFDFLPEHTESAQALRRLEFDKAMSPLFGAVTASSIEEARSLAHRLREAPEVAAVQSPSDLLPELDANLKEQLRELLQQPTPDFSKLESAALEPEMLMDPVRTLGEAGDKIGFSLQMSGVSREPVDGALASVRSLLSLLEDPRPEFSLRLQGVQRELATILERGWATARAVGERGHYLPTDLPQIMRVRFVSRDQERVALYAFPRGNVWETEVGASFTRALEAIDPGATGFVVTTSHHVGMILAGFERAAALAAVLVFLMLLWDFRRLSDALLALTPLAMGWLWMLGIMGATGITFNVANVVTLPLVLGIGIDAGVHMVHRYRESAVQHAGQASLDELLRGTGGAVFLSAITTMAGFAGLTLADYGAMVSIGVTMVIGVGTCALTSLVVLPAILVVLGRAR